MPISPRPKAKTRSPSILPTIAAIATDVLKFGTVCLLLMLGPQLIGALRRLPEISRNDCREQARMDVDFDGSQAMRTCLMLERSRGF